MEGTSECRLTKVALCSHHQYIRDLLETRKEDILVPKYKILKDRTRVTHTDLHHQDDSRSQDTYDLSHQPQTVSMSHITLLMREHKINMSLIIQITGSSV